MKQSFGKTLVVAALLLGTTVFAASPSLAAEPERAVINVTGYAQQEVAPDTAYVTVGMESTDADAQKARTKNNIVMNEVTNAMKTMGIPAENLKTIGFYVSPNYDKNNKITSYTVTNNLQIKITDLDMMSRVINKAGSLGANHIQNVCFTNEKTDQIKANLVKQAVINGRRTAEAAAQAAGSQITGVKEINISSNSASYANKYMLSASRMLKAGATADTTPVESGTNTLSQTVSMTFYIQ